MVNLAREPLYGEIEVDDTWIGGPQPGLRGSRQLKGRHAVPVLVAVERRGESSGRVRMTVLRDFTAATMTALIKQQIAPGSTIYTDGLGSFSGLEHPNKLAKERLAVGLIMVIQFLRSRLRSEKAYA